LRPPELFDDAPKPTFRRKGAWIQRPRSSSPEASDRGDTLALGWTADIFREGRIGTRRRRRRYSVVGGNPRARHATELPTMGAIRITACAMFARAAQ
jgi:hypothetical protein